MVEEFRKQGGEAYVRTQACARWSSARTAPARSASCSSSSSASIAKRIEIVGRGWEEPAATDSEQNRRVEVQWFTIE